nr:dimethylmenaquinone methyltransferase [Sphingomonas sp. CDS-1]
MTQAMSITARLLALDTPTLSDALDKLGLPGAVAGLSSFTVRKPVAGRVRTVKLGPPLVGGPKRHLGTGTILAAQPDDIIVVEHRGRTDVSGWGGLLSRAALKKKVQGIIIDGAFRDIDEATEFGLPIYARAAVPITARGRVSEHSYEEPVSIAGVLVQPGDVVLADGSGVVFIAAAQLEEVLAVADEIFRREQLMARDIDRGVPLDEILGANYEDMLKGETA